MPGERILVGFLLLFSITGEEITTQIASLNSINSTNWDMISGDIVIK